MAFPLIPRRVVSVLVLVFLLLTVWAGYNVTQQAAAARTPGPSGPPIPYVGAGSYRYTASLAPNDLFNATNVSGTNITLFVPITHWINLTFDDNLSLGSGAAVSLLDRFTVVLATAAWAKTLFQTTQVNASAQTSEAALVDRYSLNVSRIEALVRTIDDELNYSAALFTVTLTSTVAGTVSAAGEVASVYLAPRLNLSFEEAVITPTGAPASLAGNLEDPVAGGGPGASQAVMVAYLELSGAAGALGVSLWLLWAGRRVGGAAPLPPLEKLIEPYQEAIARTSTIPRSATLLPVESWEDLVKVADTLGRPILRPHESPSSPAGSEFYVFDGTIAYQYRYPPPAPSVPPAPTARRGSSGPARPSVPGSDPRLISATPPRNPLGRAPPPQAATLSTPPAPTLAQQLAVELRRVQAAPLDPAQRWYAYSLCSQAVHAVSAVRPEQGERVVVELRRALDQLLPPRNPAS